ncbi:hypothetical protein M758_7G049300 [Ceratodon purpureus]|nr:hypothetical protein M758_7G049300 [Ceratodon purpureus]
MSATAFLHRKPLLSPVSRYNVLPRSATNSSTCTLSMAFLRNPTGPSLAASRALGSRRSLLGSPFLGESCRGLRSGQKAGGEKERRAKTEVCASLATPLIAATDTWGTWTVLLAAGAFGLWSEKTQWGSALSGALVSTLVGLFASNVGLIAADAPAYAIVNRFLLPLAVPLLLFAADMRRVLASTGRLLSIFCIGSVATILGTLAAMVLVPLKSLGPDGWKIAAALMARHIGGAVNYVAVTEALGASPSIVAAGLAADNLICAIYFTTLFALASKIPPDASSVSGTEGAPVEGREKVQVLEGSIAIALSATICASGVALAKYLGFQGGSITCITAIVVALATMFPSLVGSLAPSGEGIAIILMQIFFATVGANGSVRNVIKTAPALFFFSLAQIAVHLGIIIGVGKLFKFEMREILLASNANVGGPTTAGGMATAKGWRSLLVPSILVGIFGIAIATFLGIAFGLTVLSKM